MLGCPMSRELLWILLVGVVFVVLNSIWLRLFIRIHVGRKRRRPAVIIPIDAYRPPRDHAALPRR